MIFIVSMPGYWTSAHWAQHVIVAALYAAGLAGVIALQLPTSIRSPKHSSGSVSTWR